MFSDLEHGVRVLLLGFAPLAEVEVGTDTTLVPDSNNGSRVATVTSDSLMHLGYLVGGS